MNDDVIDSLDLDDGVVKELSTYLDRLRHFVIDFLIISILSLVLFFNFSKVYFMGNDSESGWTMIMTWLIIYSLYYLLLETYAGRTVGKILNKTMIVTIKNEKPDFKQVLIRAIVRLIPFQFVPILTAYERTLHDTLSKTWVIRK